MYWKRCAESLFTDSVSHAHFSDTVSLRDAQISRTRMGQGVCSTHVISLHLARSIFMFHPPSLLFPRGCFDTSLPSAPSLPNCTRPGGAGRAHFRTSAVEFGYLADPTHSTGCEPKEFDKITFAGGDTTPINDPSCLKPLFRTLVCSSERNPRKHASGNRCWTERERRKRRFCDQQWRVHVKENSTEQYQESFSSDSRRILF